MPLRDLIPGPTSLLLEQVRKLADELDARLSALEGDGGGGSENLLDQAGEPFLDQAGANLTQQ